MPDRPTAEDLASLLRMLKERESGERGSAMMLSRDLVRRLLDAYEAQREALADARPVVANGVQEAGAPWQRETRQKILDTIDEALADPRAAREEKP